MFLTKFTLQSKVLHHTIICRARLLLWGLETPHPHPLKHAQNADQVYRPDNVSPLFAGITPSFRRVVVVVVIIVVFSSHPKPCTTKKDI